MRTGSRLVEIAAGVHWVAEGTGKSNVYLVRSGSSWVLIDAAWPHKGELIKTSAETLFGADTAPAAILLTHLHPDHAGLAAELARPWNVPVYIDPGEPPLPKLAYSDPIGRVIGPFARFLPDEEFGAARRIVTAFDPVRRRFRAPGLGAHSDPGPLAWPCQLLPRERQGADHRRCPADRERQIAGGASCPASRRSPARRAFRPGTGRRPRSPLPGSPGLSRGCWHPATGRPWPQRRRRRPCAFCWPHGQRAEVAPGFAPARRLQPPDPVSPTPRYVPAPSAARDAPDRRRHQPALRDHFGGPGPQVWRDPPDHPGPGRP